MKERIDECSNRTDWTRILSDPDLVRHVGTLLAGLPRSPGWKARRSAAHGYAPDKGRRLARKVHNTISARASAAFRRQSPTLLRLHRIYSLRTGGSDRRRNPRIKCFVAVELRVDETPNPIWGNLSNTSVGRMPVETAHPIDPGAKVEIGLWVPNGTIWVKGFALSGIVTRGGPANGVRIRFGEWRRRSAKACANSSSSCRKQLRFPKAKAHT